jgi:hypothetical protein
VALADHPFLRIAKLFDGENERAVMEQLGREGLTHTVFGEGGNCRLGILSVGERAEILAGVGEVLRGHLIDVEGSRMVLSEDGQTREVPVEPGAWFVNCTSHFRPFPHEATLSDDGLVAAPQGATFLSGSGAYYLTHAWYRGELAAFANELYRVPLDLEPKLRFSMQIAVMVLANMSMIIDRLPLAIASRFLGETNKWYPRHVQTWRLLRFLANKRLIMDKAARLLDKRFSDPPPGRGSRSGLATG